MSSNNVIFVVAGLFLATLAYTIGMQATLMFVSFFGGCLITIAVMNMGGSGQTTNKKVLADKERTLNAKERTLNMNQGKIESEIRRRAEAQAKQMFDLWKATFLVNQQAERKTTLYQPTGGDWDREQL